MLVIGHLDDDWAVIAYKDASFTLPKELLPEEAREGDAINLLVTLGSEISTEHEEDIDLLTARVLK